MADVPYVNNPAALVRFLDHIQNSGVPAKVTQQYLVGVSFKSSSDRQLIPILKHIGFLDSAGSPLQPWKDYRDRSRARTVLAQGIRSGYAELFETFPDAYRKDDEAIQNFFATKTTVGKAALVFAVRTFKALCQRADFENLATGGVSSSAIPSPSTESAPATPATHRSNGLPTVNINLELHLPATDDATVYDKLFEAMKKHLLS